MNLNSNRLPRILEENRNQKFLVSAVLLVAAFVRVSALLSMKNTIYFDYLLWDEQIFHAMAQKIANGSYHSKSVYEFSPLPIYLMAFLYKIFSPDILVIRILHMILGVLTCLNIYLTGKLLCNNSVGLLAALIAALYKPFIFYSIVPLKTSLSIFLFSLLIVLFISALIRITPFKILFLGLFAGLILNVRPNCLILIPFLPVLLLWGADNKKITVKTCSKLLILFIIGLFVAVSPFLIRNYKVAGVVALTTSQTGQNLYYGNNPDFKEPYYRPATFAFSSPFVQGIQFTIEASRRSGKKLSHDEASGFWTREIMKLAWDQPAFFAMKLIRKTLALFHRFEAGNHYHIDFISDYARFFKYPFFSFWLIMPLGIVGIFNSVTQSRKAFSLFPPIPDKCLTFGGLSA